MQCLLGVVLVMGAWNYPLQLSLAPVAGLHTAHGLNNWYIVWITMNFEAVVSGPLK
jgi:hypothetical protein